MVHHPDAEGFDSLHPKYSGGRPRTFTRLDVRIAIICDHYSPHLTTKRCRRVAAWAGVRNVESAPTPANRSWLNRIEARFTAMRCFTLDGTDHASHREQGSVISRS